MATIVQGKTRIPFMRGMLMHYLIQRGFAYEEARALGNAVREALGGRKEIGRKDIVRLVGRLAQASYPQHDVGDLVFWERLPTNIVVERANGSRPFSKEVLSHSIQATGLGPELAYRIATTIESRLIDQRRQRLTHHELEELTAEILLKYHDQSYAERYRVWRVLGALPRPLIILIGGASGVGKTTLAVGLANLLAIPRVVATDDIRQVMRLMLSHELVPALHPSSYAAGEAIPAKGGALKDLVVGGFAEQARIVSVGVRAIMDRCIRENTSVVIDGVHLLPDYLDMQAYAKSAFVVPLFLALLDRGILAERFVSRAATAPARAKSRYVTHLDEILHIQEHLLERASAHGIPIIESTSVDNVTSAAAMVVGEQVQEHPDVRKALAHRGAVGRERSGTAARAKPGAAPTAKARAKAKARKKTTARKRTTAKLKQKAATIAPEPGSPRPSGGKTGRRRNAKADPEPAAT